MFVYAVGVCQLDTSANARKIIQEYRVWYLFSSFEDAEKAVLQNWNDIFEHYYNWAVIQKVPIMGSAERFVSSDQQWWYFADFTGDTYNSYPKVSKVECPQILENTCRIWIG